MDRYNWIIFIIAIIAVLYGAVTGQWAIMLLFAVLGVLAVAVLGILEKNHKIC
ncbi:uncharacterized protein (DUF58 family) [Methanomicrobium sp. W14]|uniref:hypothetical protein n=1 Tax=Methanomicrobium sp. W14 TaxID=2817839 RepID=UPI001AE5D153|nr:hypothetical protein [Methanomicrobium sp. W14]MBP2133557.1 uncharacterized protein (DUF58 family) [Methanomicrobium sp. W14]